MAAGPEAVVRRHRRAAALMIPLGVDATAGSGPTPSYVARNLERYYMSQFYGPVHRSLQERHAAAC
jgi:hypothetical protein